jgi:glycosyltransferase involved in cell wall biosynthesis
MQELTSTASPTSCETLASNAAPAANAAGAGSALPLNIEVALLTGGSDRPYVIGLSQALTSQGIYLEVIGSDKLDGPEMRNSPRLQFLNLQHFPPRNASFASRALAILGFYFRFLRYVSTAKPGIFHILWNNKLQLFDRTLLMLYFKLLGKKTVFTAHNVNARARDGNDSALNRLTLKCQYRLADHIFVHTEKMKSELTKKFGAHENAVSIIPFGVNNSLPETAITSVEAKQRLGVGAREKTMLFFGAIWPYKGLEYLVAAFRQLADQYPDYRLIIAGESKKGSERYLDGIRKDIRQYVDAGRVIEKLQYIVDADAEIYFKAADLLVLPYTAIFQSGVLYTSYRFGLPVVATDVGAFKEDIIEGRTGFVCKPCDVDDLARTIETYFESNLYKSLNLRRQEIRDYAKMRNSWETVGGVTRSVYAGLLGRSTRKI